MTWEEHKKNFARLARDGGYTIAQYAAEFNLNPNTARRYLRAFKDSGTGPDGVTPSKPVRSPDRKVKNDQKRDQKKRDQAFGKSVGKQKDKSVIAGALAQASAQKSQLDDRMGDHEVITRAKRSLKARLIRDRLDDDGERFEFEPADYQIDNHEARREARAMLRRSGADELETALLEKTLSHLLMLESARDVCIQLVQELRTDKDDDDDDTPVEYRIASMLNSCTAQISSLVNTIFSIRNNYRKECREAEKHAQAMGQTGIVQLAYQRRRELGWNAQETAEFIEAQGGKVPALLLETIRAELRHPKPEKPNEAEQTAAGAPSLEDLDREARERAASRRVDSALWIEQRRDEIAEIVDTGGYGDTDTEGVSNVPWLEQDLDEDEEEDEEVTRKLYGEDD
ncbi:terminase [Enterobacter hormaechei]|uniref:terminase n=1 Tax=Enterobacter hormaechei TaxID=158836 RepID=UPI0013778A29|nr:terminase [Enterobacter hormaechei]NBF24570.1 terminase [Enterobacter hormaechei]